MKKNSFLLCFLMQAFLYAQTGLSVSPPRVYYEAGMGENNTQKITVTNVSTSNSLDLAISMGDWEYDVKGNNVMFPADSLATSCASWVSIPNDENYFSLQPGETKHIEVILTIPTKLSNNVPVHTAMLYVTQMNPIDDVTKAGANMQISIRSGIKLFHRTTIEKIKKIEVQNMIFDKDTHHIDIHFENQGNIWTDGVMYSEILNTETGKKTTLDDLVFYTMPGNYRESRIALPQDLENGTYVATVIMDYGKDTSIEMAELTFTYED
ncbi:molecular chaperone [Mariniflexile ostreae]|uniref:Molecular chaperone n=1 Tax=Mariniflexile ostreae TaxID=1520892 RepID=A0ABV5F718_9FLAO